jgi:hypothetical protein
VHGLDAIVQSRSENAQVPGLGEGEVEVRQKTDSPAHEGEPEDESPALIGGTEKGEDERTGHADAGILRGAASGRLALEEAAIGAMLHKQAVGTQNPGPGAGDRTEPGPEDAPQGYRRQDRPRGTLLKLYMYFNFYIVEIHRVPRGSEFFQYTGFDFGVKYVFIKIQN